MKIKVLVVLFVCFVALFGCAKRNSPQPQAALPDLLPVPDPRPNVGFAVTEQTSSGLVLVVSVKNQGTVDAPSSTTTVTFTGGGSAFPVEVPTFGLSAGSATTLRVPFPQSCFSPDCGFTIQVDSRNQVNEADENNNKGTGFIVG